MALEQNASPGSFRSAARRPATRAPGSARSSASAPARSRAGSSAASAAPRSTRSYASPRSCRSRSTDLQRAVFADAGTIPDRDEHPGQPERKKPGRRSGPARCRCSRPPSASTAGRTRDEAAEALATTPEQVRAWRRGTRAHGRRRLHGADDDRQRRACGRHQVGDGPRSRLVSCRRGAWRERQ